jgi:hypothetical protein
MLMVKNMEQRVAKEHPLRRIKQLADAVLRELSPLPMASGWRAPLKPLRIAPQTL